MRGMDQTSKRLSEFYLPTIRQDLRQWAAPMFRKNGAKLMVAGLILLKVGQAMAKRGGLDA